MKTLLYLAAVCLRICVYSHRVPRSLMYPKGASYKFNVGLGFPVDQPKKILSFSMNYQFQYTLPRNVTELRDYPEIDRSLKRRLDRSTSYDAFQTVMTRYGMEGRSCLLKTICQVAEAPIYHNGLLGELIHVLLTPGYASNKEEVLNDEYHEARRLGKQGVDCRLVYPSCPQGQGILDLISVTDYEVRLNWKANTLPYTALFAWAAGYKLNFHLPTNAADIPLRFHHRREIYESFEKILDDNGLNGRECMLKFLCEAANITPASGFFFKLIKILFTIPEGLEGDVHIYRTPRDCIDLVETCPLSLFHIIALEPAQED